MSNNHYRIDELIEFLKQLPEYDMTTGKRLEGAPVVQVLNEIFEDHDSNINQAMAPSHALEICLETIERLRAALVNWSRPK